MKIEKHVGEFRRLELERSRDMIFETKIILAELQRDHSISSQERSNLKREIDELERQPLLDQAMQLRDRARAFYAPPMTALSI
jgi:hypothetical protein